MKLFFILNFSFLILNCSFAQVELVEVTNPVYSFLKRMQLMKIIPEYNSSSLPISRGEVGKYLIKIIESSDKITSTDKKLLIDYELEFEYDMFGKTKKQSSIFGKNGLKSIFNDNVQKHLYFITDSNNSFFSDFTGMLSQRGSDGDSIGSNSIFLGEIGIKFRGTLYNTVAYSLFLFTGQFANADDTDFVFASDTDPNLKGNNNFINKKNFNSFTGYLRYQTKNNWLALTFGRTQLNSGFGYIDKLFLSDNTVPFDFGNLVINYKAVNYSFTYGSLQGDSVGIYPAFSLRELSSKNIATHSLNINFSDAFKIGLWESVIISRQPFSFTYLNPISFLTSADLSIGAEQTEENNSLLGIEMEIIPVKNFSFQTSLLIDDLTFGTLGKQDSLNENKFGWQLGALWSNAANINLALEFTHLDPFVYSHRSNKSTYTNYLMPLGHALPPNSDEIAAKISCDVSDRLNINLLYQHQRSGEGIVLDSSGNIIANYGGNINFGLGDAYLRTNGFLDGTRINRDIFTAEILWQPVWQFYFEGKFQYRVNNNLTDDLKFKDSFYFASFKVDL
ncbi:MAG: capsule assembly Wzi family protein [Bacteroidota bacterium]|nr:capsule assembly Wzi family protein [Bacteroidota bacterium]